MSISRELRTVRDTFANRDRPTDTFHTETFLSVRGSATSHDRQPFLNFGALPRGVTIVLARVHMYLLDATTGSRTHTLKRVQDAWAARSLTWNNRPAVSATNPAAATVGALAAGTEVVFDITLMAQDAANAQPWYGVRMESSDDVRVRYHSYQSLKAAKRPWLELVYATKPNAPTDLSPADGMYVGAAKPLLSWLFSDPAEANDQQSAYNVQVATDSLFTVGLFDTGWVTSAQQSVDLNATAYAGAPADSVRYWRVRVRDLDSLESGWSDVESFVFHANGTLTINNPPVGATVDDVTPTFTWALSGATQQSFQVIVERSVDGGWLIHADSGRQVSASGSWMLPSDKALQPGTTYRVTVRTWDTFLRAPGNTSYVQAQRQFTYVPVAGITAPTNLTAVKSTDGHEVTLTWQRSSTPDYFALLVDGVIVMPRIDPADVFVSGTTYSLKFWRAVPRVTHTYEVQAVVLTTGSYRHSSASNPTDTEATTPIGITLVDEETDEHIRIMGKEELAADVEEVSRIYKPIGRRSGILVTDTVGGLAGGVGGRLITYGGIDAQTYRDTALRLRTPGRKLRLVLGDENVPVKVYALTAIPRPDPGDQSFDIRFSFFQTGEFATDWDD